MEDDNIITENPESLSSDAVLPVSETAPTDPAVLTPEPVLPAKNAKPAASSAVTVYIPEIPEGPTATQLEKAVTAAQKELRTRKKADRKRLRLWKKDARSKAILYLRSLRDADTPEERAAVRNEYHADRRAWRSSLRGLDPSEKQLQKKAYRVFRRRITRTRRRISLLLAVLLLAGACFYFIPGLKTARTLLTLDYPSFSEIPENIRSDLSVISEAVSDEGIVLLENKDDFLPLKERKLCVFGEDAWQRSATGTGTGQSVSLLEGLESAGISCNLDIHALYRSALSGRKGLRTLLSGSGRDKTVQPVTIPDEVLTAGANDTRQALVTVSCPAPSGTDYTSAELTISAEDVALLRNIDIVFSHIILVIAGSNPPALDFLDTLEHVDAVLWAGCSGPRGSVSLGRILTGELCPSGRLTDTWVHDPDSAPASVNRVQKTDRYISSTTGLRYAQYEEGIYVGYRYYETVYRNDASGYRKAVRYPFGYGLSYTSFSWNTLSFSAEGDEILWKIRVTNTGEQPGKDILQLYFTPPYDSDNYEGNSETEKSSMVLVAYAKTALLPPDTGTVLTLTFPREALASFSMEEGAWVADAGTYTLSLCRNVHDVAETRTLELAEPEYRADAEIVSRFSYADGGLQTLSRSNWTGTYPRGIPQDPSAATLRAELSRYNDPELKSGAVPETDANNGIKLSALKGLSYDDPLWSAFLDQFSLDELYDLFANAGWRTSAIPALGIPETKTLAGGDALSTPYRQLSSAEFPPVSLVSSAWNTELAEQYGETIGALCDAFGAQQWYGLDLSLHRTLYDGNFRYSCSEDPLLTGKTAAAVLRGVQSRGILSAVTGFGSAGASLALEEGVSVFVDEQALRELYLHPFEIAVKEGLPAVVMTSRSRLGCRWCGADSTLLTELLRGEWGFDGAVITAPADRSHMKSALACLTGTDLMFETGRLHSERTLRFAARSRAAGGYASALRECAHRICYTLVNRSVLFAS